MSGSGELQIVEFPLRRGLLGAGALVLWGNLTEGDDIFNHWYTHEHLPERINLPGFHRARRYVRLDGQAGWRYFTLYEVETPETLSSGPYMDVLNAPTPATQRCVPMFSDLRRTACRVTHTVASGQGGQCIVHELGPQPGREAHLRDWLTGTFSSDAMRRSGTVAVHLLEADSAGTEVARGSPSYTGVATVAGRWMLIVEGAWEEPGRALDWYGSAIAGLQDKGATADHSHQMFRLLVEMSSRT
jgi:hypothetical protein